MSKDHFYFSLQYSAIQKTVLRHDRLWSIAGISQILSVMNELELPKITRDNGGEVLVAGGGKFTARFEEKDRAETARDKIIKTVSTTLPMLEFQSSKIVKAATLKEAKDEDLIEGLNEQKRRFRGYGVTYNPHLAVCEECGEYPAAKRWYQGPKESDLCRTCYQAKEARSDLKDILKKDTKSQPLTSLERIYARYWSSLFKEDKDLEQPSVPADFEKLFPEVKKEEGTQGENTGKERRRMAVWFSDANNMNGKVPVWLSQQEDDLPEIFKKVKEVNIEVISGALYEVFKKETWNQHKDGLFLPFRLVVAGGDDLCLVMPEEHILDFTLAFSRQVSKAVGSLKEDHFLHEVWLEANRDKQKQKDIPGPYCFGASFVVTPVHTPFKAIHSLGESLMSEAKKATQREADSINWQILNVDEEAEREAPLAFEKPVFIQQEKSSVKKRTAVPDRQTFEEYLDLRDQFREILSGSQMKNIAAALIAANGDSGKAELALIKSATAAREKGLTVLLSEPKLRRDAGGGEKRLDLPKVATLLELMNLKRGRDKA